jgi:hypothetical protein
MHRVQGLIAFAAGLLAGAALAGPLAPASAQEFPITPDPAACRVDPRPTDEVIALWFGSEGSPAAAAEPPRQAAGADAVTIPVGPAADAATAAAVTAAVAEVFACFAAGDFPRALALFTDDLARSLGPGSGASVAEARALLAAAPEPVPAGERDLILAVTDVMALADGRVGAFIVTQSAGGADVGYVIFARQGDRWLLDEDIHFSPGG